LIKNKEQIDKLNENLNILKTITNIKADIKNLKDKMSKKGLSNIDFMKILMYGSATAILYIAYKVVMEKLQGI